MKQATFPDLSFINKNDNAKHPSFYFLDIIQNNGLSELINNVSFVSRELGISRKGYYDFLHSSTGISPIMAVRLAAFFKKYLPDNESACDYYYWWSLHSKWYFDNEIRKHCIKEDYPSCSVYEKLDVAESMSPYGSDMETN